MIAIREERPTDISARESAARFLLRPRALPQDLPAPAREPPARGRPRAGRRDERPLRRHRPPLERDGRPRPPGADARAAGRRSAAAGPGHRLEADAGGARPRRGAGPPGRAARRRRALLRPLRLLGREHGRALAARAPTSASASSAWSSRRARWPAPSGWSAPPARRRPSRTGPRRRRRGERGIARRGVDLTLLPLRERGVADRRGSPAPGRLRRPTLSLSGRGFPRLTPARPELFNPANPPRSLAHDRLARARPHQRADRHDRLRLHRPRHPAR